MNIEEIAKKMTRKEFEERIYENIIGDESKSSYFNIDGSQVSCPHHLKIDDKSKHEGCTFTEDCYKCWINAVKNIKFKGEDKMEFSKKDLKNGMVVELQDGSKRMVLNGKLIDENGYIGLNYYLENLTVENEVGVVTRSDDINKVYQSHGEYFSNVLDKLTLIWERGEDKMKKEIEVPFMEAIEKYNTEQKTIKCIWHNNGEYIYKWNRDMITDNDGMAISSLEILEGKWYILY